MSRMPDGRPRQEIWQKYYENGEYLRSVESGTEENYNMIDGLRNNRKHAVEQQQEETEKSSGRAAGKRVSVLQRLREKQEEVARRYGKQPAEQAKDDMERNRK